MYTGERGDVIFTEILYSVVYKHFNHKLDTYLHRRNFKNL